MKLSEFSLNRLDDFVAAKEKETLDNPLIQTPFGSDTNGNIMSGWEMSYRRIGMFTGTFGINMFSRSGMIMITVPRTRTGIKPLVSDMPFGWDGKINSAAAETAVWWAFELTGGNDSDDFMCRHNPEVIFSYIDSNGPGEITVKFNGEFWLITG